jgi:calcineurin-like phosphoesterase family protein
MIYFSADHHFDHANIIRYCGRPFAGVNEMNEEMVRRWNSVVGPSDTVYYLGDFSMAKRPVLHFGSQLNGEKRLIIGNHDRCHPRKQSAAEVQAVYRDGGFTSFDVELTMQLAGQEVLLNHFPYFAAELAAEYVVKHQDLRPKDRGLWLLHGHVHEKWKIKDRMINVGVDAWDFYPVPLSTIESLIHEHEASPERKTRTSE